MRPREQDTVEHPSIDLQNICVETVSGITYEQACVIGARNGIQSSNRDISALALFTLSEVFRDALTPLAKGAESIAEDTWDLLDSAVQGISRKMSERITGATDQPNRLGEIIGTEASSILRAASTTQKPGDEVLSLIKLGHTIEAALDDAAPLYIDLEHLTLEDGVPFRLRLNQATYRLAGPGEAMPTVSILIGSALITPPAPTILGSPVATLGGHDFTAPAGEFLNLMSLLDHGEFSGVIKPNYLMKDLVFEGAGSWRRAAADCWFVRTRGKTVLVPPLVAMHILGNNLEDTEPKGNNAA